MGGGSLVPPRPYFLGQSIFFWKEVFFVHSHTAPPFKNAHPEVLKKMYTFIFQTSRTENRAKKGSFSTNLGAQNGKTGQNGSFWPLFGDFRDFSRNEPLTFNPTSPWTEKYMYTILQNL